MLDLRRLRLLRELHARGTIAAVADALQFTPSAVSPRAAPPGGTAGGPVPAVADALQFAPSGVSQQLAALERDAGVPLLERAGRGVRLTDAALVLVEHAGALLERAALAESDLAAASGTLAGRARIAGFQSVMLNLAIPAMKALERD